MRNTQNVSSVAIAQDLTVAPRIRRFPLRRFVAAASVLGALGVAGHWAIRELAALEPVLSAQGAQSKRAIVYELPSGSSFRVPIEPRIDVLRFVVHAYRKGAMSAQPKPIRVILSAKGSLGEKTEEVAFQAPGTCSRVAAEDRDLSVGDPIAFEIDVHDIGAGDLVVRLAEATDADGLLVRAYRREQLSPAERTMRARALDREQKEHLAEWAWELGWDELTSSERAALLGARWQAIGALRGSGPDLVSRAVAISPPSPTIAMPRDELLGRVSLRGDERLAFTLHPGARVRLGADTQAALFATTRDESGAVHVQRGAAEIEVGPFPDLRSVEVTASSASILEARASNAADVEWLGWTNAFRATKAKPVVVESPEASRVLRVSARRPSSRTADTVTTIGLDVELLGLPRPLSQSVRLEVSRSRLDRYQDADPLEAPTDPLAFYVAMPMGSRVSISPETADPVDIALAELDIEAPPLPLAMRAPDAPPPAVVDMTERVLRAFVPRVPSNAGVFGEQERKVVRTARWLAPAPPPVEVALAHAKHTNVDRVDRDAKPFDGTALPFELDADARRPLFVPITIVSEQATQVVVDLDPSTKRQPAPGVHMRWTLPRALQAGPEPRHASFVLGDDVPTGKTSLRLSPAEPAKSHGVLVHLPWASTRAEGPRWIAGAFEQ